MIDGYQQYGYILTSARCQVCGYRAGVHNDGEKLSFIELPETKPNTQKQKIIDILLKNHKENFEDKGLCDQGIIVTTFSETIILT